VGLERLVDLSTISNRNTQFLLLTLPLLGRVCTADAMHTHITFIEAAVALGAAVVLTAKANQPALYDTLTLYFADSLALVQTASTTDHQKGRTEVRSIRVSTEMNAHLSNWPHLAQVAQLTRTVTIRKTDKTTCEVVYLLTTLSPEQASPERLLELVRGHWSIENSLHYVRDVTFAEDRSRLRSGYAPQLLAAFRNLALTLIHRSGSFQIAVSRRHFAFHPDEALAFLLPHDMSEFRGSGS
jgi:predicted transposase YbfD/YdcC